MRVTILGCGTSGGVPRLGGPDGRGDWGDADPADPRNRRRRCSILVQDKGKTVLVDTSPDLRAQLAEACQAWLFRSPSRETRKNYQRDLEQFLAHLGCGKDAVEALPKVRPST